ncbi:MAG: FecR family protein [Planctomycetota bacterium]|nr:FecR family protein [Planctomycetota bacterium]
MDRETCLALLDDVLDGASPPEALERLGAALRADAELTKLAAEYQFQDACLAELFGPAPAQFAPERLLERARKRAKIVEAEPAPGLTPSPLPAPAPEAPDPGKRKGRAAGRKGVRGTTRPAAPVRGSSWKLGFALLAAGSAALIALAFYLRDAEPPAEPQVVEQKTKDEKSVAEPSRPKPPADPIAEIKGGNYTREGNLLATDHVSTVNVKLADGSAVEMKPRTRIRFAAPTEQVRQELDVEQGHLVVSAAHAEALFRVRVGQSEVTVLGTRFVVDVPEKELVLAQHPVPARVECLEGRVRLKNEKGELDLEREHNAVLCDAFAPQKILRAQRHEFAAFSGILDGVLLAKDAQRILVKIVQARPDRENKLERAGDLLKDKIAWLFVPPERFEGAEERARHFMQEHRVMDDFHLDVWGWEGRFVFAPAR